MTQLLGLGVVVTAHYVGLVNFSIMEQGETYAIAGIAGASASLVSAALFRAPWWWWRINLLFPLAVVSAQMLEISAGIYFSCFVILVVLYWNATSRIPLYLTNRKTAEAISELLPATPGLRNRG